MTVYITCIDCGVEVKRKSGAQKRCPACAQAAKRVHDRASKGKSASTIVICIGCGMKVGRISASQKRCSDCAREAIRDRDRAYRRRPRNRLIAIKRSRRWRQENPDRAQAHDRSEKKARYRAENRDTFNSTIARWRQENPDACRAIQQRVKRLDASIDVTRATFPWTPAEDDVVMSWTEGLRELGAVLGRSRNAVGRRRQKLRKRASEQATRNEGLKP